MLQNKLQVFDARFTEALLHYQLVADLKSQERRTTNYSWKYQYVRPRANGRNNSQQCWGLQCIVGRIKPISLCKPCVMSVRGPNNVGRAVQTDPTLLRYASAITEEKKCWELLAEKFNRFQTLRENTQQHPTTCNRVCKRTQHITSNNVGSCWSTMLRPFAWGLTKRKRFQE